MLHEPQIRVGPRDLGPGEIILDNLQAENDAFAGRVPFKPLQNPTIPFFSSASDTNP